MQRTSPSWSSGFSRLEASTVAPWAAPGPEDGVDLVDEQDRLRPLAHRCDQRLEALLEVAAVAGPRQQRAEVEGEDLGALQVLGHLAGGDPLREALGDRRLPDAGLAHEDRVVLAPPRQHVDRALELALAPDQRVELALLRALGEVRGEGLERDPRGDPRRRAPRGSRAPSAAPLRAPTRASSCRGRGTSARRGA